MILAKKETSLKLAGNNDYKETDSIYSVQSVLMSHSWWVTLVTICNKIRDKDWIFLAIK